MDLNFSDFNCYINASIDDKCSDFYHPEYTYSISTALSTPVQTELYHFILERGNKLTLKSLYQDRRAFSLATAFLEEAYPELETITALPLEEATSKMERWLTEQGIVAHPKTSRGTTIHASLRYLQQVYKYYLPKEDYIYFNELDCYKSLTDKDKASKHYTPDSFFNLGLLPITLREDFKQLIFERGQKLRFTSMTAERRNYNHLCKFISETFDRLPLEDSAAFLRKYKVWAMKNGYKTTVLSNRKVAQGVVVKAHPFYDYAKLVANYLVKEDGKFHFDADIWNLDSIDSSVRISATNSVKTLNFSKITQESIKTEVKNAALFRMKEVTIRTITAEIHATAEFSRFLSKSHSEIHSLRDVDREIIEEYLIYLNTEDTRRKNYRSELMHLKSTFTTLSLVEEDLALAHLFIPEDFPKNNIPVYRFYTDAELQRLNQGFRKIDPQTGRMMILHELLGCRISETLTLKSDCITQNEDGKYFITIWQSKVNRSYRKPVNKDVVTLIQRSIEYTTDLYGEREYVFVCDKDPSKPFQYGALYYRLQCMIIDNDLRDDHGQLFTVGTHLFRKTYGKRLCDMGLSDAVIAKLLGHNGTSSVKHYRRMSSTVLADSTYNMRETKSNMIRTLYKGITQNEKQL